MTRSFQQSLRLTIFALPLLIVGAAFAQPSGGRPRDLSAGSGLLTVRSYELQDPSVSTQDEADEDPIAAILTGVVEQLDTSLKLAVRRSTRITLGAKDFKPEELADLSVKGLPLNVEWVTERGSTGKTVKVLRRAHLASFDIEGQVGEVEEGADAVAILATPAGGRLWLEDEEQNRPKSAPRVVAAEPRKKKLKCSIIPEVSRILDAQGHPISAAELQPEQRVAGSVAMTGRASAVVIELRIVAGDGVCTRGGRGPADKPGTKRTLTPGI